MKYDEKHDVVEIETFRTGRPKGIHKKKNIISPKKWEEVIQYYKSGHSYKDCMQKYGVGMKALQYQIKRRGANRKNFDEEQELTEKDIAILDREASFKDKIKAELKGAKERFDSTIKVNQGATQAVETIADEATRLKIYDEVLPILKEKNPILAKNLSALSAKVLVRANALLDTDDLSPRDLNEVASALSKINDILQIIPKTQPLIAQQFNIGSKESKETTIKDVDIKIEFI